jgi:uncharacterized protein YndB with AHSA1/START domain
MAKVTPDADAIVSEIPIAVRPEHVFQALVDPEQVLQRWGQGGVYTRMKFLADLRTGGKWRSASVPQLGGQWLEVDPPRLLVCMWVASWTGKVKTTVRWELEPTNRGTLVRIRHNGLAAHPEVANSHRGWPRMWGRLQALLESGETVDDRRAISAR